MKEKLLFNNRRIMARNKLLIVYTLIFVFSLSTIPISGSTTEFLGQYEITAYLDYAFSGKTTISRDTSESSLTTYFGTYSIGSVTHYSDVRLSHSSQGYIRISDWNTYIDDEGNVVKSESTWSVHVSGYQDVTFTSTYEYGNYLMIEDSETIYDETYTQRVYEDGSFQESLECHDIMQLETVETIITNAGAFECARININYYENEIYSGYSLSWISDDGILIQEQAYDENDDILMEMSLSSESEPVDQTFVIVIIAFVILGGCVIAFYLYKRRTSSPIPHQQAMTRPGYSINNVCPQCGAVIRPLYKFCEACGSKVDSEV